MSLPIQYLGDARKGTLRALEMAVKYRSGKTLQEVANDYGITRERVRQILRRHGVEPGFGGQAIKTLLATETKKALRLQQAEKSETACFKRYGMSRERLLSLSPYQLTHRDNPVMVFRRWCRNVKIHGFRVEVRFFEWWNLWEESGRWEERGNGRGYSMGRWDTDQGFSKDNLRVVSGSERMKDAYRKYPSNWGNRRKRKA